MKTIHKIITAFSFALVVGLTFSHTTWAQPGMNISRQDFYDELSPYGDWMDYPSHGQVWRPRVDDGFQPYASDGRWEMTEYGNTWVSDYNWGWAPFHYGRWLFDNYYGWIWIPDYQWGPAWVSWRSGGGYYGWAPLGPGINVNINIPYNYWVFVPDIYIRSPRVYSYCVPRNRLNYFYGNTMIINNYYRYNNRAYIYGPQRRDIERITRSRMNVYRADDLHRQGRYNNNNQRNYAGNYGQNDGRNDRYSQPNDNRRNNNGAYQNERPRYNDNNTANRQSGQTNRSDNGGNPRERVQQPENTAPQPNRKEQRTYQAPERGGAQRTWSDNGVSQSRGNQEASPQRRATQPDNTTPQPNRQEQRTYQAPERGGAQRTWSDNGGASSRDNSEAAPQRRAPEYSGDSPRGENSRRRGNN